MPADPRTQPADSRYAEIPPSAALAPWVECYWSIRGADAGTAANRVLPDGCSDIILGLADMRGPVVVGTMTTAEVYPLAGRIDLFGIRFRPGRALPFLDVPLSELTDRRVPLDALWGSRGSAFMDAAPIDRVAVAERVLTEGLVRWRRPDRADEAIVGHAIALLRRTRGGVGIAGVASALGVGERRLQRAFDRCVGLTPKAFDRVLRLRRAVARINASHCGVPRRSWTAVAFDAGYADQSHLIREFRALVGVTPGQYATERHGVGFVQYDGADRV